EVRRRSQTAAALAVVTCDVDGLKTINDRDGHDAGDAAIVRTGQELRRLVGKGVFVSRCGGDEFPCLTSPDAAERMSAVHVPVAGILWPVRGLLAIVFGVWLALHESQYSLGAGWVIAAIVLWVIGSAIGGRLGAGYRKLASSGATLDPATLAMNVALMVTL